MDGAVGNVSKVLDEKPEGDRAFGRPKLGGKVT